MKNFFTLTLCFFTLSLTAQEAGCTYSIANNYSSTATVDDGTCVFGGVNVFDYDNDGNIAINDFIAMLSYFGDTDSDSDGVFDSEDDCIDVTACNLTANPTEPCLYVDAIGVCDGHCTADLDGDGICDAVIFINCGDDIGHDDYAYSTVEIGDQCWFSENCRYLPSVSPRQEFSTTSPYYYVYDYQGTDVEAAKATANYATYGVLYNWPAVMTEGICPSGWHIPSDGEWQTMEISLGMSESEAADTGHRGTDEGYQMKSTYGWNNNGNNSNSSGFTGLPGGQCYSGGFQNAGYGGKLQSSSEQSSSESGSYSWVRGLEGDNGHVFRGYKLKDRGYSARCIKD